MAEAPGEAVEEHQRRNVRLRPTKITRARCHQPEPSFSGRCTGVGVRRHDHHWLLSLFGHDFGLLRPK